MANMIMIVISALVFSAVFSDAASSLTTQEVETCLGAHNKLRGLHENTPALEWDDDIAALAQAYAEKLVAMNKDLSSTSLVHEKPDHNLGENLYWRDNKKKGTCAHASLSWYNEINDYSYATASSINGKPIGHFTQVVWEKTMKFGVGIATMPSRKYSQYGNVETFIVAKYAPRGNSYYVGKKLEAYTANVLPRKPGAVTPTVEELDPSLKPKCVNVKGDASCQNLLNWGYKCFGNYKAYFKEYCFKLCGYC